MTLFRLDFDAKGHVQVKVLVVYSVSFGQYKLEIYVLKDFKILTSSDLDLGLGDIILIESRLHISATLPAKFELNRLINIDDIQILTLVQYVTLTFNWHDHNAIAYIQVNVLGVYSVSFKFDDNRTINT